ncbi:hypothetical protein [Mycobacterium uberis]|uniref:hypothetical protein n=1 Tax=Mycobacterium uberis TaxID=2162698 RepID=UPI001FB3EAB9|nr:hypothetical protein [Mycobacterium uberis]
MIRFVDYSRVFAGAASTLTPPVGQNPSALTPVWFSANLLPLGRLKLALPVNPSALLATNTRLSMRPTTLGQTPPAAV